MMLGYCVTPKSYRYIALIMYIPLIMATCQQFDQMVQHCFLVRHNLYYFEMKLPT